MKFTILVAGAHAGRLVPAAPARGGDQRRHHHRGPGSLAREVGGDQVTVESIARGYQDPHFVEAEAELHPEAAQRRPAGAVGRELEIGWLPPLISRAATRRSSRAPPAISTRR